MFNLERKKNIEVYIEPWVKNRDTNRIVSLVYCYSPTNNQPNDGQWWVSYSGVLVTLAGHQSLFRLAERENM